MTKSLYTTIVPLLPAVPKWQMFLLWSLPLFWACGEGNTPYRDFYFPIRGLEQAEVYVYEPLDQPGLGRQIWLLQGMPSDSGWILHTRIYDQTHTLLQEIREQELANGVRAISYRRYLRDSSGQVLVHPMVILRANLFPYAIPDTSRVFTFQLRFSDPGDSAVVTTRTRYRRFKGMDRIQLADREYPSLVLGLQERIEIDDEGMMTLDFSGEEVYAEGIGLAAWQQVPAPGDTLIYLLKERLPRTDYERNHGILP